MTHWHRPDTTENSPLIPELIAAQARKAPHATAVIFERESLLYRDLDERANQLAWYLIELGVGPDDLVAVALDRSLEMVIALLAVLKAGGAYVPIDPGLPPARIADMIEDCRTRWLLVDPGRRDDIPRDLRESGDRPPLTVIAGLAGIAGQPKHSPPLRAGRRNLAYVIYTSGSTGKPKGVAIEHGSLSNLLDWARREIGIGAQDVVVASTTISFDIAGTELLLPLMLGASIALLSRETVSDGVKLARAIAEHGATVMQATPTGWELLLASGWAGASGLRLLTVGEALTRDLARRLLAKAASLCNLYGPTETTIYSSSHETGAEEQENIVTIGRPLANTQIYVLDEEMQPVPAGGLGEIYIGGAGVARGYLGRPALTAERFLPDPFGDIPGARLYRTGDLARRREDGLIDYAGRTDHQVKIRGYRIELGEIEAALDLVPGIGKAVVVVRADAYGQADLVAYLTPERDKTRPAVSALRQDLKRRLPDYMIPSIFNYLEAFPLTANGKIDRKALPPPVPERDAPDEPPQGETETRLAAIWTELLKRHPIGRQDNFFDLGGHSLLATRLISRLSDAFKVAIPMKLVFAQPILRDLAAAIAAADPIEERAQPIARAARDGDIPLSPAQERMWFLDQLVPGTTAYHLPLAVRLSGHLDREALRRSLDAIIRRHEVLRTRFSSTNGKPRQVIESAGAGFCLRAQIIDAEDVSERVHDEARRAFRLDRGQLFRAALFALRHREDEHVLVLTFHHIASDGWSQAIFLRELGVFYAAHSSLEASGITGLPALPIQYADFACWQRQALDRDATTAQLAYWQDQLGGRLPLLDLPLDKPRPAQRTQQGAIRRFRIAREKAAALRALGRRENATLFMTLLALFNMLLHRYSGAEDILIGTPVAGRGRSEIENLIGFFVNTLVIRTDLKGSPSFLTLLRRVKEVALEALAHPDIPFEKLVEVLSPPRDLSRTPIFQAMFVLQNEELERCDLAGLASAPIDIDLRTAQFDLTLSITETPAEGLLCFFEYDTALFYPETIDRMIGHLQTLIEAALAEPETEIARLPLLSQAERERILFTWNETRLDRPDDRLAHQLFEAQARKTPQAPAVIFEGKALCYRDLAERAAALAEYLRGLGVGPDVLVGISLDRSPAMIIALLGVLKAGGAYVPIDPTYPAERKRYMLGDSRCAVLITEAPLLGDLPIDEALDNPHLTPTLSAPEGRRGRDPRSGRVRWGEPGDEFIIVMRAGATEPASRSAEPQPMNLAYVIYTSGSTGAPKGTMLTHAGLRNLIHAQMRLFGIDPPAKVLQFAPFGFDASVWEIFLTLCTGGSIVLARKSALLPGPDLLSLLRGEAITRVTLTPSALAALPGDGADLPALSDIILGGEACPPELVRAWARAGRRFFNAYGPTECTVCAAVEECDPSEAGRPAIGRPIANVGIYILDPYLEPVPIGIAGELYIAGPGLARGYGNRPDLTAERFIPHPWSSVPGERLYRTGDLARYLGDGRIDYLGRIDHQVKLRGFRIELGEIEAALGAIPGIESAVALVREDRPGEKLLVAYLVARNETARPALAELRDALKKKLPDYMVPQVFLYLSALPLAPNDKVDRRALPAPPTIGAERESPYVAPRNSTESALAEIWAEILRRDPIGIDDNFFDLGGHSLSAVRLVSRVGAVLGAKLSINEIFRHPTIAELAPALGPIEAPKEAAPAPSRKAAASARIEQEPLQSLLRAGRIEPVDAAALVYWEAEGAAPCGPLSPHWSQVLDMPLGRIGLVTLPCTALDLYGHPERTLRLIGEGLRIAREIGARTVSLTGAIPTATNQGRAILDAAAQSGAALPALTSGSGAVVATILLNVEKALRIGGRQLEAETLGVLGLGFAGTSTLRLMLSLLPHPREILLCDVYREAAHLEALAGELREQHGFAGAITVTHAGRTVPAEFYRSTFILGATNAPSCLDIERLRAGTILVDDSGSPCFAAAKAAERFRARADILFTGSGVMKAPFPIGVTAYIPPDGSSGDLPASPSFDITGCVLASLLCANHAELPPVLDRGETALAARHHARMTELGFEGADMRWGEAEIARFRQAYGGMN